MKKIGSIILVSCLLIGSLHYSGNKGTVAASGGNESDLVPVYSFDFDGELDGAIGVRRENDTYYGTTSETETGELPTEISDYEAEFVDGKINQAIELDGKHGIELPVSGLGESYTISFWVAPRQKIDSYQSIFFAGTDITDPECTTWVAITKTGDGWLNGYACPAIWSHNAMLDKSETDLCFPWYAYQDEMGTWLGDNDDPNAMALEYYSKYNLKWTHIILTVNADLEAEYGTYGEAGYVCSSFACTYINGELFGIGTVVEGVYTDYAKTYLGIDVWNKAFAACYDDVKIYDCAINSEQALALYEESNKRAEESLVPPTPTPTVAPTPIPVPTLTPVVKPTVEVEDNKTSSSKEKIEVDKVKKLSVKNKKKKKAKISWKKITGVKGYQVQYATNKKFKGKKQKVVKKNSVTISKLKKKKTYYFRVRAYKQADSKVYGKWSVVKKIKIKR